MGKTQTLQAGIVDLPKRVAEKIEMPVGKRKPPRAKQVGAILGTLLFVTSALYVGRTVRKAIRNRAG